MACTRGAEGARYLLYARDHKRVSFRWLLNVSEVSTHGGVSGGQNSSFPIHKNIQAITLIADVGTFLINFKMNPFLGSVGQNFLTLRRLLCSGPKTFNVLITFDGHKSEPGD